MGVAAAAVAEEEEEEEECRRTDNARDLQPKSEEDGIESEREGEGEGDFGDGKKNNAREDRLPRPNGLIQMKKETEE